MALGATEVFCSCSLGATLNEVAVLAVLEVLFGVTLGD
jgi:hypothetical protein